MFAYVLFRESSSSSQLKPPHPSSPSLRFNQVESVSSLDFNYLRSFEDLDVICGPHSEADGENVFWVSQLLSCITLLFLWLCSPHAASITRRRNNEFQNRCRSGMEERNEKKNYFQLPSGGLSLLCCISTSVEGFLL